MFAAHQKTSSGQKTFGPQPMVNYSKLAPPNKSVPLANISPVEAKFQYYCFYCNHRSYSKSEINQHMVQKHSFPFKCQFCDFGSLTKDHVFRHMREMHAPSTTERPMNLMRKHSTVSNALPGPARTSSTSSVSPFAQITKSCSETIVKKVDKDGHRGKTVKSNILPKDGTELFAPLNEQIVNNKPLTIALPKEVTIPAGCFVELIEVNTVNGKKELKLRLVSQQPSGSLVKDCRDTTSQKATAVAAAASSTTTPTRGKPASDGTCTANRLTLKRKNCNQHVPKNNTDLRNHFTHFQMTVNDEPRECNSKGSTIRPEIKNKEVKGDHCVSHPKTHHLTSPPATGVAVTENIQAARSSINLKPGTNPEPSHLSFLTDQVSTKQNVEERSPLSNPSTWTQTGGWDEKSFGDVTSGPEALPVISCVFSLSRQWEYLQGCPPPLLTALRKMAMGDSTPPVKTSLIYDKQTLDLTTSQENNLETTDNRVDGKDLSPVHEQRITPETSHQQAETEKTEEHDQHIQIQTLKPLHIKEENRRVGINSVEESTQQQCLSSSVVKSTAPARTKSLSMFVHDEAPPSGTAHIDPTVAGGISGSGPQDKTNKQDICPSLSSYLTIPLKRIKLEGNKLEDKTLPPPSNEKPLSHKLRQKKKRKLAKVPRSCSLDSSGNFVCLKADQHVKQPGPNQPVVVLNLAKPQTLRRKAEADSINDTIDSEVIPTCHILKMKLNKVMGQKYEVSGCTVRLCLKEG